MTRGSLGKLWPLRYSGLLSLSRVNCLVLPPPQANTQLCSFPTVMDWILLNLRAKVKVSSATLFLPSILSPW